MKPAMEREGFRLHTDDLLKINAMIQESVQESIKNFKCGKHDDIVESQNAFILVQNRMEITLDNQNKILDQILLNSEKNASGIVKLREEIAKDKIETLEKKLAKSDDEKKEKRSLFANYSTFSIGAVLTIASMCLGFIFWTFGPLIEKIWTKLFIVF